MAFHTFNEQVLCKVLIETISKLNCRGTLVSVNHAAKVSALFQLHLDDITLFLNSKKIGNFIHFNVITLQVESRKFKTPSRELITSFLQFVESAQKEGDYTIWDWDKWNQGFYNWTRPTTPPPPTPAPVVSGLHPLNLLATPTLMFLTNENCSSLIMYYGFIKLLW